MLREDTPVELSTQTKTEVYENSSTIVPFSLKNTPSLIEKVLPAQKISIEAFKEQMASHSKTLVSLGGYWKGRKPLILNKACILGCLLPATDNLECDLEIFELLMGMDTESLEKRLEGKNRKQGKLILRQERSGYSQVPYRELVKEACRPEECGDELFDHIWDRVNKHLGTQAQSFPEFTEQLGIMRFGHRPRVADTFCGSGQIPFEAARLGCDVHASDLNPIACMLTWGAFNIVGGTEANHAILAEQQQALVYRVQHEIDRLGVETDGQGWRAKVFLYCVEVRCPETGWLVPLLPTRVISKGYKTIAQLIPDSQAKRYDIAIVSGVSQEEMEAADQGTVRKDGRGQESYLMHTVEGVKYRTRISSLRGDYRRDDGSNGNRLRLWGKNDFKPRSDDIFQERLYCVQWMRHKKKGKGSDYEFRAVTKEDLQREQIVEDFIAEHLEYWQKQGWVPDMLIEPGYNTDQPIRERGWTHWHHLFNPRQLLVGGITNQYSNSSQKPFLIQAINYNSKLSTWNRHNGGGGVVQQTFINQALNTLFDHGCRASATFLAFFSENTKNFQLPKNDKTVQNYSVSNLASYHDIYLTDPPYGNAVKYEEILEFFIAWLRKNPPAEFSDWTWDSCRALAIKGEDEDFRRSMVAAYSRMADNMTDNGIQVVMFTHQSLLQN